MHEGNTEEEDNGYVVFKWNMGMEALSHTLPTHFKTAGLLDRYLFIIIT